MSIRDALIKPAEDEEKAALRQAKKLELLDGAQTKAIHIRVTPQLKRHLEKCAEEDGRSLTRYIVRALLDASLQ